MKPHVTRRRQRFHPDDTQLCSRLARGRLVKASMTPGSLKPFRKVFSDLTSGSTWRQPATWRSSLYLRTASAGRWYQGEGGAGRARLSEERAFPLPPRLFWDAAAMRSSAGGRGVTVRGVRGRGVRVRGVRVILKHFRSSVETVKDSNLLLTDGVFKCSHEAQTTTKSRKVLQSTAKYFKVLLRLSFIPLQISV